MSENDHKLDADFLETRLQTLRLTGFPSPLLERLLVVQPPPVRQLSLSRRMLFAGALAALPLAAVLILAHPGYPSKVITLPLVVARKSASPSSVLTGQGLVAPRANGMLNVAGPVPRESLAAYQRTAAQGDEAWIAMLNREAATASPSLAVSRPLSPLDYRLFEND